MLADSLRDPAADAAFLRLRQRFTTWAALAVAREEEVQPLIALLGRRPGLSSDLIEALRRIGRLSGALRLDWLETWTLEEALEWLTALPGVSDAAARAVLNVSTLQRRTIVIDSEVLRVVRKLGLCGEDEDGRACADALVAEAPADWDADTLRELHVQLARVGEGPCRPRAPDCGACPLKSQCAHAASRRLKPHSPHTPANDGEPDRLDAYLRRRIAKIEREGVSARTVIDGGVSLGRPIDDVFVGGVMPAGLHQFGGGLMEDGAARFLLAFAILAAQPSGLSTLPLLVVQERDAVREYGQLHGPGLEALGVDVGRAAFVQSRDGSDALFVVDEALRQQAARLIVLELRRGAAGADTAVTRRLNLQARRAGVFVILLTPDLQGTSAATTRWRVSAAQSEGPRRRVGAPRAQLELVRNRAGGCGRWLVEWRTSRGRLEAVDLRPANPGAQGVSRRMSGG